MAEQDLCEGRSSVAVHHCIRQLSYCRRDIRDSAGVWGEVSVHMPDAVLKGLMSLSQ